MNSKLKIILLSLALLPVATKLSAPLWTFAETDVHAAYLARCHSVNGMPDPHCTPGTVFKKVTAKEVCTKGYAAKVRNVSVSKKRKVYERYGLSYPQPYHTYVLDHLVSLELGGSNALRNLWVESYKQSVLKDKQEDYLHSQVCKDKITLKEAQERIVRWSAAEQGE